MTTFRFSVLIGLAIGAIWAFTGIGGAFVTLVVTAVAAGVGYAINSGAIDLSAIVGRRSDD